MSGENGHYYDFKSFRLNLAERQLLNDATPVPLTPKSFDVLAALVTRPGHLVEKDELMQLVWPDSFVEESNVARIVHTLRKILGEGQNGNKFIETVSKKGYRFVADVNEFKSGMSEKDGVTADEHERSSQSINPVIDGELPPDTSVPDHLYNPAETAALSNRRPPIFLTTAIALTGIILAVLVFGFFKGKQPNNFSFEQITQKKLTQSGNVYAPRISPDGQYLAYVSLESGEHALCVRQVLTGSILRLLPVTQGARYWALAIAPDNSFLYYVLKESNTDYGNLYRIPLFGGQSHKLLKFADGGLTVSPDGTRLGFVRIDRQARMSSIVVVNSDGTDERTIDSVNFDSSYNSLAWSPDGKSFVSSMRQKMSSGNSWFIAELPAEGGKRKQIGDTFDTKQIVAEWLPNKIGLIVNAVDKATRQPQLYFASYPDGVRRRLSNDLNYYYGVTVTADGKSVVALQLNASRAISVIPAADQAREFQLTKGNERHFDTVAWAADKHLIFDEGQDGSFDRFNIWSMRPDGTDLRQLTFGDANNRQPTVSQDGRTIVFVSRRSGQRELWRMDSEGGNLLRLTHTAQEIRFPKFSADEKNVFYIAAIGGTYGVWQVSVDGGEASPVIDADVYGFAVSPDGERVAYSTFESEAERVQTHIYMLRTGTTEQVLELSPASWLEWSKDGRSLYFTTSEDGRNNIWNQSLDGSKPRQVTDYKTEQVFAFSKSRVNEDLVAIRETLTYDAVMFHFE